MKHVYFPGHGVGRILGTEIQTVLGRKQKFYRIEIVTGGLTLLVPAQNMRGLNIRPVMRRSQALKVMRMLIDPSLAVRKEHMTIKDGMTNKIYAGFSNMLDEGTVQNAVYVFASLMDLKNRSRHGLSHIETHMLSLVRGELEIEVKVVLGLDIKKPLDPTDLRIAVAIAVASNKELAESA